MERDEIIGRVGERTGLSRQRAEAVLRAVLATVGERISAGQAGDLGRELPGNLRGALDVPGRTAQAFDAAEFCRQVGARTGMAAEDAHEAARRVFSVLRETVPEGEIEDAVAQLTDDYRAMVGVPR